MNRHMKTSFFVALAVLLVVFLCMGCTSMSDDTSAMFQPNEGDSPRVEDLKYFCTTLPKVHNDFFANASREDFNEACADALANADAMTDAEFYFTLNSLSAFAGDSHTSVGLTQAISAPMRAIPGQIAMVDGKWRFTVLEASQEDMLGAEIVAINSRPMAEIFKMASRLYGHDNETWLTYKLGQQLNLTSLYTYFGIADDEYSDVKFTVVPFGTTEPVELVLIPVSVEEFYRLELVSLVTSQPWTGRSNSLYRMLGLDDDTVFFIQYNVCASWDQLPIEDFTSQVLTLIAEHEPRQVIVDLRYNNGGNSMLFEPMIKGLVSLQQEQGFPIDVLIGPETFSSAIWNAYQLKMWTDCRLVGSPTGGSVNHFGEIKHFVLPNSGIPVYYSTKYFTLDANYPAGSLIPDLLVSRSVEDLKNGVDAEVQAILR